jgi:hypothetical protein
VRVLLTSRKNPRDAPHRVAAIPMDFDATGKAQGNGKSSRGKREHMELFPKSFARDGKYSHSSSSKIFYIVLLILLVEI